MNSGAILRKQSGKPCILIGDVGDNLAWRNRYFLHLIKEPDIRKSGDMIHGSIRPSWSISFTYEDGPHDCESVAVDVYGEKILLLSKRDNPPVLYELPLREQENAVAGKCVKGKNDPGPAAKGNEHTGYTRYSTGMDISPDGMSAVVLTYTGAFYIRRNRDTGWATAFSGPKKKIMFAHLPQAECICFNKKGTGIYITTEQLPAPLIGIDLSKIMQPLP